MATLGTGLLAPGADAQVTTAIRGVVVDAQDAAVPGATVALRQPSSASRSQTPRATSTCRICRSARMTSP